MRGNLVEPSGEIGRREIRPRHIELVIGFIEASVADQEQHHVVVGLGLLGEIRELRLNVRVRGLRADQRFELRVGLALENHFEFLGPAGKTLFVFRFAAEAGDGEIKRFGVDGYREPTGRHQQQRRLRKPSYPARSQITPHFLRSSHSTDRSINRTRNTTGMSHRSRVSRTVMPASE